MTPALLIDQFVRLVNAGQRARKFADEVPPSLRVGTRDEFGYDWRAMPTEDVAWVGELQAKLPAALPPSYRSLISRYHYPAFEVGPIVLLANTSEGTEYEFRTVLFADRVLSPFLLRHRFIQFAKPGDWSYDPVCFDARLPSSQGECPIVRVDHEAALCHDRLKVVATIAPTFPDLLLGYPPHV